MKKKFIDSLLLTKPSELKRCVEKMKIAVNDFLLDECLYSDVHVVLTDEAIIIEIPIEDAPKSDDEIPWPDPKPWLRYVFHLDVQQEYDKISLGMQGYKLYWFHPVVVQSIPSSCYGTLEDELYESLRTNFSFRSYIS